MQFLLPWQTPRLEGWARRSVQERAPKERLPNAFHDRLEVTLASEPPGDPVPGGAFETLEASVLGYRVFGPEIGQTVMARTPVQEGDTIGLVYKLLGVVKLFFASRVVRVHVRQEDGDGGLRSGFVYQTLEGHPEVGEEIFEVRKDAAGNVIFRIEAWSRPNLWYVRIFTPWARMIQRQAARSAVANLAKVVDAIPRDALIV